MVMNPPAYDSAFRIETCLQTIRNQGSLGCYEYAKTFLHVQQSWLRAFGLKFQIISGLPCMRGRKYTWVNVMTYFF